MTIQLAPNAMSTVELLKKTCPSIPEDAPEEWLIFLINYASGWIERVVGRSLGLRRYLEDVAGSGQQELVLRNYPIRDITAILARDMGMVDPSSYAWQQDGSIGVVWRDMGWIRRSYPTGLVPDYVHSRRYLQVDYTAGYVLPKDVTDETPLDWILPYDLQGIISEIADQEYSLALNGSGGLAAFSIADVSWTFDKAPRQSWLSIIGTYTKVV